MTFPTFSDFQTYLDSLGLFSMSLGLERMHAALERLDLKHPKAVVAHVVGTNGKGSTSGFLDALARIHGLRSCLYQSPHLVCVRERIRIDGRILSEAEWLMAANAVMASCPDLGLTYFELLTVMALYLFRAAGPDIIILEAGLGGTHDATCAVRTDLAIMTPIGLDHEAVLGPTLADIARDKAGALGRCPAVSGPQPTGIIDIFLQASDGQPLQNLEDSRTDNGLCLDMGAGAHLDLAPETLPDHAPYQLDNAGLALLAWSTVAQSQNWPFQADLCKQALARTRFAGRFCRHGNLLVDGAHNIMGLTALCEAVRGKHFDLLIFQAMCDKTQDQSLLERLRGLADRVTIPALPGNNRACEPSHLAAQFSAFGPGAGTAPDLRAALGQAHGPVLLCGSLYLVGELYTLHPEYLELF